MKTTAIRVLRNLLIPVGFIWATGIFSKIQQWDFSNGMSNIPKDPLHAFDSCELATLEINPSNVFAYGDSLIKMRKKQTKEIGGIYDPYLYFRDLKQYNMFEKVYLDSLDKTADGRMLIMSCLSFAGGHLGELVNLRDASWRKTDPDKRAMSNYTQMAGYSYKNMSVTEARWHWFPAEAARELAMSESGKEPLEFWTDIALPILGWLQKFYLKGLPFAFFLFLIWKIKFGEESEQAWRSEISVKKPELSLGFAPLSFLISLLLWPVILYLDIRNRFNEVLRKAEVLSRRRNMFSLLSKPEQKLVEIGRKMSLKEFRVYLENIGMARKHSFRAAFVVTCFLIIMPRIVTPTSWLSNEPLILTTVIASVDYGGIDDDVGHDFFGFSFKKICKEIPLPTKAVLYLLMLFDKIHFPEYLTEILSGFLREIFGVPKEINQVIKLQFT